VSSNSTSITRFTLAALLFALTGCDPEVRAHGRVASLAGPIRPAEIRVNVPIYVPSPSSMTTAVAIRVSSWAGAR